MKQLAVGLVSKQALPQPLFGQTIDDKALTAALSGHHVKSSDKPDHR
jgi:hypothetical protein